MYLIGIDWADQKHDIYIQDDDRDIIDRFTIDQSPDGLASLVQRLDQLAEADEVAVAIETRQGLVVEVLLDAGHRVYPINPKTVDRFRDRFRSAGTKSDYFDAMVLADILRTDRHRFDPMEPGSEMARELKLMAQDDRHLIHTQTELTNRLTSCLKRYDPELLTLFGKVNQKTTLTFLLAFPTPQAAGEATEQEIKSVLRKQRYPGVKAKTQAMVETLNKLQYPTDPATVRAKSRLAQTLARQLLPLLDDIQGYRRGFEDFLSRHPDGEIFLSLPGAAETTAARIFAEFGDNRDRFRDDNEVQCQAGTAPVTKQSGSQKMVVMRQACRKSFREVIHPFAFASLRQSEWAKAYYDNQRSRGNSHHQALRALGNKWLKRMDTIWQRETLYDEEHHQRMRKKHQPKAA